MRACSFSVTEPRAIAEVAIFLASDAFADMTGSIVYADGERIGHREKHPVGE